MYTYYAMVYRLVRYMIHHISLNDADYFKIPIYLRYLENKKKLGWIYFNEIFFFLENMS